MTITESYIAATGQARSAVDKSLELWKQSAQTLTDQSSGVLAQLPQVDLAHGVERYFDFVQRVVASQREYAITWASAAATFGGAVREQAESVTTIVRDQAETLSGLAAEQVDKVEQVGREQAEKVDEAAKEQERLARAAKRQLDKQAHEEARQPYVGLTKAELSELLAERELPKTGNLDELIERLVEADAK